VSRPVSGPHGLVRARAYVDEHLADCAAEADAWLRRGDLEGVHLKAVARMITEDLPGTHDALQVAERLVELAALSAMRELSAWRAAHTDEVFNRDSGSIQARAD